MCLQIGRGMAGKDSCLLKTKKEDHLLSDLPEFVWLREKDLNLRPSGYEPDELPDCSIPRQRMQTLTDTGVEVNRFFHICCVAAHDSVETSSATLHLQG